MGRQWGANLLASEQVELVGWVDIRPQVAAQAAQELALRRIYVGDSLERAIAETRPDFVVDVTVPEAHYEVTLQALDAGVAVLGEKPLADTLERAKEMVGASERAGRLFMVSQNRRYDPYLEAMRRLILHETGFPGILNSDFYIGAHFGGFRDHMPSPLLLDMSIHTFDAARYLSGADPLAVYCEEFNPEWSWYEGNSSAVAIFEMTGGLRYSYRGSWCSEGRHTSWEGEWRAVGPRGSATWDGEHPPVAEVVVEPGGFHSRTEVRREQPRLDMARGIAGSLRDFLEALRTGATPMGECHDNIKSLAMIFAAMESARGRRRVEINL